jgi:hypothetical protein
MSAFPQKDRFAHEFNERFQYPRTPHLPWSPGSSSDDIFLYDFIFFAGREVVATEKLDGECTTMYPDGLHARSPDGRHHPSRDWVKGLHGRIAHLIPAGWRLCGENVYARHSIAYEGLASYFFLFSIWDEQNRCLPWDDMATWASLLEIELPPLLYRGPWDEATLRGLTLDTTRQEGYVLRTVAGFHYDKFAQHSAKWVREGHIQTDQHWMHAPVIPNQLQERS